MNKYDQRHLTNVRYYQWLVRRIFQEAAKDSASLAADMTAPDDGIFSFDDYPRAKVQIDKLQAQMATRLEIVCVDGINAEWALSNEKNDALVDSLLAEQVRQAKYYRTNEEAKQAFILRKEGGLSLSDRVWRYTDQFKEEMELGIDCGLREGLDAPAMARRLKQYLQHPDMLFRRVRDEHGNLQLSQRAAAFHPGQGVYRSSYKNARRLAATETNIAYRTADHERWQQLDFIVGIEIQLSNNHTCLGKDGKPHPFYDICDELKGKYPKDFKFVGWHPHCRCIATTILKTKEEMDADDEAILRGEEPTDPDTSENAVTELPDNFKQWMESNEERIARAKSQPYFIRDNDKLINPTEPTPKVDVFAALDKAVAAGHLPKVSVDKLREIAASGDTELFERRATSLQAVAERHAARTKKQVKDIRQRWEQKLDLHQYTAEQVANFTAIEKDLGVKRGLSMSHVEANQERPNPNFMCDKAYRVNCQSCVITYELRRRGFDLETLPKSTALQGRLAYDTNLLWIDPKTGKPPVKQCAGGQIEFKKGSYALKPKSKKKIAADFEAMTAEQGRYHMTVFWKGGKSGHIVTCESLADGTLRIYDPQTGKSHTLQYYLDNIQTARGIGIQRVDNLILATGKFESTAKPLTQVVKKAGTATPRTAKQGATPKTTVLGKGGIGGDNGGQLITDPKRIEQANKSKQEMKKFKREQETCNVVARHGHTVEHLDDTSLADGRYDALVDGRKADLKRVSSANNILKEARRATKNQGAEIVVFQFDVDTPAIQARVKELKRKGFKFMYYFTGKEDVLYDFT